MWFSANDVLLNPPFLQVRISLFIGKEVVVGKAIPLGSCGLVLDKEHHSSSDITSKSGRQNFPPSVVHGRSNKTYMLDALMHLAPSFPPGDDGPVEILIGDPLGTPTPLSGTGNLQISPLLFSEPYKYPSSDA